MPHLILFILAILLSTPAAPQGYLRADGQKILNERGENILWRGIGLGGWMLQEGYMLKVSGEGQQHKIRSAIEDLVGIDKTRQFYEAWLKNNTTRSDLDSLKAWGFNAVRLPMHYNLYTLPLEKEPVLGKNTWLEIGFAMTDSILEWCRQNEMYLLLDLHAAPGGQGNDLNISDRDPAKPSLWESEGNRQKTIALWRKLAERYAGEPWIGGYDLINEPNWGFQDPVNDKNGLKETGNKPLRQLLIDITRAIREVDKHHIIIIEGNGWGNNYKGIFPLWDDNIVVSFHKYWNYNDVASIQNILDTRSQYNVPVWLGETGENSNVWYTQAIELLESHNIGWTWWPLKKLGVNNPLEIPSNPDYEKIISYWRHKRDRPSESESFRGIMKLADDASLKNNIIHYDVIDAMMRQPHTNKTIPFKEHRVLPGSIIRAIDYDLGKNGLAYYDMDTADYHISNGTTGGNKGRLYRNDGVDIRTDSVLNDLVVYSMDDGEWLQYSVYADKATTFNLQLNVLGNKAGGSLEIIINGQRCDILTIHSGDLWEQVLSSPVRFNTGDNQLRIGVRKGGIDFQSIEFVQKKHAAEASELFE